MFYRQKPAPAE